MIVLMIWRAEFEKCISEGSGILTRPRKYGEVWEIDDYGWRVVPTEELDLYQIQGHTFISHKLFQEENWKKMKFE